MQTLGAVLGKPRRLATPVLPYVFLPLELKGQEEEAVLEAWGWGWGGLDTIGAVAETLPTHRNPEGRSPGSASPSRVRTGQTNLDAREHRSPLMKATWPGPGHKEGQTRMECQASLGQPGSQTSPLRRLHKGLAGTKDTQSSSNGKERHLLPLWDGNVGREPPDSSSMKPPSMGFVLNIQGSEEEGPLLATTSPPAE